MDDFNIEMLQIIHCPLIDLSVEKTFRHMRVKTDDDLIAIFTGDFPESLIRIVSARNKTEKVEF